MDFDSRYGNMDFDSYLNKYMELILAHFMFPIHPLVVESMDKKFEMKISMRKHMYEYSQRGKDRVDDLTKKMLDAVELDSLLSTYYLTLVTPPFTTENEKELAFSACNRAFVSTKAMLVEYRNQVFRRLGYV
jgi:hypothetical protein